MLELTKLATLTRARRASPTVGGVIELNVPSKKFGHESNPFMGRVEDFIRGDVDLLHPVMVR